MKDCCFVLSKMIDILCALHYNLKRCYRRLTGKNILRTSLDFVNISAEEADKLSFLKKGGGRMTGMLHEECGVFGIFEPKRANIADSVYFGLLADTKTGFCKGCFTGSYPEDVSGAGTKNKFDEKIHK